MIWLSDMTQRAFGVRRIGKRIIALHDIDDMRIFQEKMIWLKQNYAIFSLDDLLRAPPGDASQIAITFDDGYESWHTHAIPILRELRIPATFFVCSGFIGLMGESAETFMRDRLGLQRHRAPLTHTQLKDIVRDPLFEIGSHTVHHVDLGAVHNDAVLKHEIGGDRAALGDMTGAQVKWLAYPFGKSHNISPETRAYLERNGLAGAFTIIPGFINLLKSPFDMSRDSFDIYDPLWLWQARLNGAYDWIDYVRH